MLDMPAESDWVFFAPIVYDRALMRNAVVYALSEQMGHYASRTRFVEVFVADNASQVDADDYLGVYILTEKIKRDNNRVAIEKLSDQDVFAPEVEGGYIFKVDRLDEDPDSTELGFQAGGSESFTPALVHSYPKEDKIAPQQLSYLIDYIDAFAAALNGDGFVHPETNAPYGDYIDMDSWIDFHILNVVAMNPDALRLSTFTHKDRGGKLMAGPQWDFDRTMGSYDDRDDDPTLWYEGVAVFTFGWWGRLFQDPVFLQAYEDRLFELLADELSISNIHALVDSMAAELDQGAAERNFAKWNEYPPITGVYAGELAVLKDWIEVRVTWISGCLALAQSGGSLIACSP